MITRSLLIAGSLFGAGFVLAGALPGMAGSPTRMACVTPLPEGMGQGAAPLSIASPQGEITREGFKTALRRIQSEYYGTRPGDSEMTYAAIRGMLNALGDRYTRFLDPDQFRRMQEESSGEFGSIGVTLKLDPQSWVIVDQVDPSGPGAKIGLKSGDVLTHIAGHPVHSGSFAVERANELLHGNPGTAVSLTVKRKSLKKPLKLVALRAVVLTPTVSYRFLTGGIGYIKIDSFGERSDEEVGIALRKLKARGMRSLILDMRGNPGGYFNSAVDIASRFIEKGPVVFTKDRDNRRVPVSNIPSKRMTPRVPLVVLVDHWSASAAEIVAAAIQDTGAGIVVGEKTYGKALVQTINPIPDGSALLVTTHHYYTPRGTDLSRKGIQPNIELKAAPSAGNDPALKRAVAWLNETSKPRISNRKPAITPKPSKR